MEEIIRNVQQILSVPTVLINSITFLPDYVKEALITSVNFIPFLYFLYYGIELLERFFLKRTILLVKLMQNLGAFFGVAISTIPECGFQVIASAFYSRKMITRGTLLAFFIACSDDALPLLFMDFSKALVIFPIIIIKVLVGLLVAYVIDLFFFKDRSIEKNPNVISMEIHEPACCHHLLTTREQAPYWWMHPVTHTFNMFMFTFLSLVFINCVIKGFGSADALAQFLKINSPIQVVGGAIFGLIPNCVTSVFLAVAYVKGIISFPALLAGLVTTTGLGLSALVKHQKNNKDNTFITVVLLITGIATGMFVYCNNIVVSIIQEFFK